MNTSKQQDHLEIPAPRIELRTINEDVYKAAMTLGLPPILARILGGRLDHLPESGLDSVINPSVRHLPAPSLLKDANKAAQRIAAAVLRGEDIVIQTDVDVDGSTGNSIIYRALSHYFGHSEDKIHRVIGHKLKDGYGLSENVADKILELALEPGLLITADCGSSDEDRISTLAQSGWDCIVTDHHEVPPDNPPVSAYAFVNPTQEGCPYPDKTIAGCNVAWLVMTLVRQELIDTGHLPEDSPKLVAEMAELALGTVADCVTLESPVNRAVIHYGLSVMNQLQQPCWRAARKLLKRDNQAFVASDCGFALGPAINARSRINDPYASLYYLTAKSDEDAERWLKLLMEDNEKRKEIERGMTVTAKAIAAEQVAAGAQCLMVYLEDGHSGVKGIVASRLVEAFGRPAFVLTPKEGDDRLYEGSGRSVKGLHLRDTLQAVVDHNPGFLKYFGGHKAATGKTGYLEHLHAYSNALELEVRKRLGGKPLYPVIQTDGDLEADEINMDLARSIDSLEPFGREFERPVFTADMILTGLKPMGDGTHYRLKLQKDNRIFEAVWFRAVEPGEKLSLIPGCHLKLAFEVGINTFRGASKMQLMIRFAKDGS